MVRRYEIYSLECYLYSILNEYAGTLRASAAARPRPTPVRRERRRSRRAPLDRDGSTGRRHRRSTADRPTVPRKRCVHRRVTIARPVFVPKTVLIRRYGFETPRRTIGRLVRRGGTRHQTRPTERRRRPFPTRKTARVSVPVTGRPTAVRSVTRSPRAAPARRR